MSARRVFLQVCQRGLASALSRVERNLAPGPAPQRRPGFSLQHAYATGWADYPCVFVLSTGRGGTETLTALAGLSPGLVASHEPFPRLIKASYDAYLAGASVATDRHWIDLVLASRDDLVRGAVQKGKVYVETNNRLTYLAPALATAFPASRFIHVYRDPFAFVRSAMRRRYFAGHDWDFARVRPRPDEPLAATWNTLPRIECCAWLWARTNSDAHAWMSTLPPERRLSLRAEDLFEGRPETLQAVFGFCGVEVPPRERVQEVLGAKLNAQQHGNFPEAGAWAEEERERVWKYTADIATALGYSRD
ncbi:hypothetical protein TBR22_A24200 [Luteitalea sp. TBR-22]|uniref:sulfotransferase n=1 Tax=Luteitalea sp. TBR-22 TaxID=2802971 RepID=UPI001AFAC415|nr:sulfotransferase [Luteitalea sp. TBR-22]BCS33193.1 hypothetical protein TBR22_A24200 [Luteitalea sp. TBR-22]